MNMKAPKCLFDPDHMHGHALPQPVNENNADFSEYMWMAEEDIEQFDQQVEEELWEELFLEACFEQMLAEEEEQENVNYVENAINSMNGLQIDLSRPPPPAPLNNFYSNQNNQVNSFYLPPAEVKSEESKQERPAASVLNPEAPEFVPRYLRS